MAELREEFARAQVSLELVAGAELMLDLSLLDLAPEEIPTYGGQGRFCLIEFPFQELPVYTDDVLFDLQTKGITPSSPILSATAVSCRIPTPPWAGWSRAACCR